MSEFPGGQLNHINPILNVSNLENSIAFYTNKLGLNLLHTFGNPITYAIVGSNGCQIYLSSNSQGKGETWLSFFVDDLSSMYNHLKENNAEILLPLSDKNEFQVADPDGHVLRFFK